jgi:hypothetical protein
MADATTPTATPPVSTSPLPATRADVIPYPTQAQFAACLDDEFALYPDPDDAVRVPAILVEVVSGPRHPRLEQFTLRFRARLFGALPQRTYLVEHTTLGRMPIFLVPVGVDAAAGTVEYEAVFNRLKESGR